MKKLSLILLLIIGIALFALAIYGFSLPSDNNKALAEQREGLFVFAFSKPANEYEYLGTVKAGMVWAGKPSEMIKGVIKNAKKDYPTGEAVVFTSDDMQTADVIRFK